VIRRLHVHNFRCLENFDLPISGLSSVLLIGNNGSGKTTVGLSLEILQKIARGMNRVGELLAPKDLARGRTDVPVRFEIDVDVAGSLFAYSIAFEFPKGFKELRVREERLAVDGNPVYTRDLAQVSLAKTGQAKEARFSIDWHLVALPIIQDLEGPLEKFKRWLGNLYVLRPDPGLMQGTSSSETLAPNLQITDFGAWFTGLMARAPSAYKSIDEYLKEVMPDFKDVQNVDAGPNSKSLRVHFLKDQASANIPFGDLSDGEKCFMVCAMVLASNHAIGPMVCFWDEPDSYLALPEVGHFVMALRRAFQTGGQFIATSHNPEAIRRFSDENTLLLHRNSHLEPTIVRRLSDLKVNGDLVEALTRGDLEAGV
jgi:predicted ATPase